MRTPTSARHGSPLSPTRRGIKGKITFIVLTPLNTPNLGSRWDYHQMRKSTLQEIK